LSERETHPTALSNRRLHNRARTDQLPSAPEYSGILRDDQIADYHWGDRVRSVGGDQRRRFEVPASPAASSFRNFKSISGT